MRFRSAELPPGAPTYESFCAKRRRAGIRSGELWVTALRDPRLRAYELSEGVHYAVGYSEWTRERTGSYPSLDLELEQRRAPGEAELTPDETRQVERDLLGEARVRAPTRPPAVGAARAPRRARPASRPRARRGRVARRASASRAGPDDDPGEPPGGARPVERAARNPRAELTALRLQLALVAGNAPPAALLEVRAKAPGGMAQRFFGVRDLDGAAAHIRDRAGRGDTYIGAAPRGRAEGDAAAVSASYALWCDLDRPDARAALDGFDPPPSMIVATGTPGHLHAWWQLSEPLPAGAVAGANRRLAHALAGDPASCDVARVLRPCATLSHKTDPPRPVTCELVEPGRAYSAAQVVGGLPDPPERRSTRPPRPARAGGAGPDPLAALPAVEYVEALTGATVPRDGMIRCPLPGHHDRTPSFHAGGPDPTAWRCFGCEQAGGPYELAALLAGLPLPLRGSDYIAVRGELLARLGGGA